MRPDAVYEAALQRAVDLSVEVEGAIRNARDHEPLLALIEKARGYAASAIVGLATADPEVPSQIRTLQNNVAVFGLLISWLSEIVAEGYEASDRLTVEAREDLAELIGIRDDDDSD